MVAIVSTGSQSNDNLDKPSKEVCSTVSWNTKSGMSDILFNLESIRDCGKKRARAARCIAFDSNDS